MVANYINYKTEISVLMRVCDNNILTAASHHLMHAKHIIARITQVSSVTSCLPQHSANNELLFLLLYYYYYILLIIIIINYYYYI